MAIQNGFFKSINGDRRYLAEFFTSYFASFIGNGVFPNPSTNLQVINNQNFSTIVRPGKGWINGHYLNNDDNIVINHQPPDGVLRRIDRIVFAVNLDSRSMDIYLKQGTASSAAVAPALVRNSTLYELALADISFNPGATSISQSNITDQRMNKALCGIVHGVVEQLDTTTLFNQYQQFLIEKGVEFDQQLAVNQQIFDDWFAQLNDILDGDVAANLANMIITHTNNATPQKHIEVVSYIPQDLANKGLLLQIDDLDNPDNPPEIPTSIVLNEKIEALERSINSVEVNVKLFGAKGDDVTNDTQAFTDAISYLKSLGGGTLFIPLGTYLTNFEIPSNVIIKGSGINTTILKSVPGSNKDVIKGENYDALSLITTPVASEGVRFSIVKQLTVDGNKNNNTAGNGIRIWGAYFSIRDVIVQNCAESGIVTRFTTHVNPTQANMRYQALESVFNNIKIFYCRNGWIYNGPHDSQIINLVIVKCTEYAFNQTGSSGGLVGHDWNFWANGNCIRLVNTLSGTNIVANNDGSGNGLELVAGTSGCRIANLRMTGFENGLILRGDSHLIKGTISDSAEDALVINSAIRSNVELICVNNKNIVNNISETGANSIRIMSNQPNGGVLTKGIAFRADDFIDINVGARANNIFQLPTSILRHYGWSPSLPLSNGTILATDSMPTGTLRGGVLKQVTQADVTDPPTAADFNRLLADLRRAGVLG